MKKSVKLDSKTLKRIIAEEKKKLQKDLKIKKPRKKKRKLNSDVLKEIKYLLRIKKEQEKRILEFKKLHEVRKKLKKSLVKRL